MSTINLDNKTILVTGAVGFIGSNLVKRIYQEAPSATVIGIDNMNAYYDVALKEFRLNELAKYPTFTFVKGNIADKELITELFEKYKPSVVVNLAAQAGVRYSITNPNAYVESNLVGFFNILEACRHNPVEHLVYASSSSVYGSKMKLAAIHHVAIIVSDYEKSKDFYVNKLGFAIVRENFRKERNDWKLDLRVGEGADAIELEIFAEPNPPKRVNRPEACGLRHLAFRVEDVEATVAELEQMGIGCEPIRLDSYTQKKMTFFFDPDGLPLELHE